MIFLTRKINFSQQIIRIIKMTGFPVHIKKT